MYRLFSDSSYVNGDIAVENRAENGVLHVVSEELRAKGNGTDGAKGSISLTSDGSLQTDAKLAAADDVNLTSVNGDVSINDNIYTGRTSTNALVIRAGGAVTESAGTIIATPVVETHSGKGVSLESDYNQFAAFRADALDTGAAIDGSVKAVTHYAGGKDYPFKVEVGTSIKGDAEFTNRHKDGGLELLIWKYNAVHNNKIEILGGNDAKGNLVLNAGGNVGLLGNTKAAHDIVVSSANGSFSGLGREMEAGHDVLVSAGDAVTYLGTIDAGNDMDIRVTNPSSDGKGIRIGDLAENGTLLSAGNEARFYVQGDGGIHFAGDVTADKGDVIADISGTGNIEIYNSVQSENESVSLGTGTGNIVIGADNTPDDKTITAKKNVTVGTNLGTITIQGETSTETGDITMKAGKDIYEPGKANGNFIIKDNGKLVSGGGIVLNGRNGDIEITEEISAQKGLTVHIEGQGSVDFGTEVNVTKDVDISTDKGSITVGHSVKSDEGSIRLTSGEGNISIGDSDAESETVTAKENIDVATKLGTITVLGKTSTADGDISMSARGQTGGANLVIDQEGALESGRSILLDVENGDVHVSDKIKAKKDLTTNVAGTGSVYFDTNVKVNGDVNVKTKTGDVVIGDPNATAQAETITAGENVNIDVHTGQIRIYGKTATENGDISMSAGADQYTAKFENIVIGLYGEVDSGRDVRLTGRNGDLYVTDKINAKRDLDAIVNCDGGLFFEKDAVVTGDGVLAGNYIYARSITADNGGKVFHLSTMGPDNTKLIGDEIYIGSVRSKGGTETPSLWTNRGYLHVDEGNLDVKDVLAVDKLHLENEQTTLAVYGRTPTKDGEQLVYWNNVGMADSKTRGFQLFTDGKVRTRKAVLVDSYRNYSKLLGDNLSVVDMMRDRVTHERGQYTFDSKTLTEPGRLMREPVFFGMESTDVMIQQQNAPDAEIVIESF